MKKNIFWYTTLGLMILLSVTSTLCAQECIANDSTIVQACCNGQIGTDSATALNNARPSLRNRFEWRNPTWDVYIPTPGGGYTYNGIQPLQMGNPFFTRNAQLNHLNFAPYPSNFSDPDSLDFHPRDGWELLHKYDGFDTLGTNYLYGTSSPGRPGPYVMLYNRYTGRLRILASFQGINPTTDLMQTELRFKTLENLSIKPTTLFMKNKNIAQPLSEKTSVERISTVSRATSTSEFFAAEFDLSYDPCICLNYSEIQVDFSVVDTSLVNLSGRLIGTNQIMNTNGTSPLLNNQDFLTTVYKNGLDVEAGTVTYKNIDALIAKYQAPPGLSSFEQIALGVVGSVIKVGIGGADKWLTAVIDGGVTQYIQDLGFVNDTSGIPDTTFKVKTGLKIIGDQTDRILVAMGLKSAASRPPNTSVIEAEMAITGSIKNISTIGGNSSILLRTPGSLGSDGGEATSPWFYYPTYNEPLGVFALLDSPLVRKMSGSQRELYPYEWGYEGYNSWLDAYWRYRFEDIEYVFNPAAEVDVENTVILAALVVKGSPATRVEEYYDYYQNISTYSNHLSIPNIEGAEEYYVSPFLSLECLKDYIVGDFEPGSQVFLRLMIQYVFKENALGKVNQTFEILTYPVRYASATLPPYTYFPDTLIVDGTTTFTSNAVLKARNVIVVTGGLTINAGVTVSLVAGREVLVNPGVSLPPGVSISVGVTSVLGCNYPAFSPVPVDTVKAFCNSTRYKANQLASKVAAPPDNPTVLTKIIPLTAFPNPFTGEITLEFDLPETTVVSITLYDLLGRPVMPIRKGEPMKAGPKKLTVEMGFLAAGLYHVVLEAGGQRQAVKVVKE